MYLNIVFIQHYLALFNVKLSFIRSLYLALLQDTE